jgi:hypothetical protein
MNSTADDNLFLLDVELLASAQAFSPGDTADTALLYTDPIPLSVEA